MKIKINVTQRDIDKAEGVQGDECPIYQSIQRHSELKNYTVGIQGLYNESFYPTIKFPCRAKQFSRDHWLGKKVKPFSFTIDLKKS